MESKPNSVRSILAVFQKELKNVYDRREIDQFIYLLFNEWNGWNRMQIQLNYNILLPGDEVARFHIALEKLKNHVPVQYILGKTSFHGLDFIVSPDVLIPRPETEELMNIIINENIHNKTGRISILDIGTGSGCIAVTLKKNFPLAAVSAIDTSEKAIRIAMENANRNDCQIEFRHFDIFFKKGWTDTPQYDIIVSNPPYVLESEKKAMRKNVVDYEPWEALFVPDDDPLLYYDVIAEFAFLHLSRPGVLYLEINEDFGFRVKSLLSGNGFTKVDVLKDINEKDRFIRGEVSAS